MSMVKLSFYCNFNLIHRVSGQKKFCGVKIRSFPLDAFSHNETTNIR
jgi:hypothetical protein